MPSITDKHSLYTENLADWTACEDFFLGDTAVKAGGEIYLPKLTTDQEKTSYDAYKARGLYFGAVGRTVKGLTGSALLKEPEINLTGRMEFMITTQKVKDSIQELLKVGRHGLLVDMPEATINSPVNNAHITQYSVFNITNWETDDITGQLIRVVLLEYETFIDDDGDKSSVPIYRELILEDNIYKVRIWKMEDGDSGDYIVTSEVIPRSSSGTLNFIPFIFMNPIAVSEEAEISPVQDMVATARWHYQRYADYSHALHFTALPTLWATGVSEENAGKIKLGSQTAIVINSEAAQVGFIEFEGKGLDELVNAMRKAEDYMAFLGARLLEVKLKGVESAETHRLKQGAEIATLSSIVDVVESAYRLAIEYANIFLGTSVDPETAFSMSRDFIDQKMSDAELTALMNDWINGGMSYQTYHYLKEQGELTRPGVTAEEELDQIEAEGPVMNTNDNP